MIVRSDKFNTWVSKYSLEAKPKTMNVKPIYKPIDAYTKYFLNSTIPKIAETSNNLSFYPR